MALPPARYFTLSEVAKRWGTTPDLIVQHALDELIEVSMMVVYVPVRIGYFEEGVSDHFPVVEEERQILHGPQPLSITDIWHVHRTGSAAIGGFKPKHEDGFVEILPPRSPIPITLQDLLVTREERDRFEKEHSLTISVEGSPARQPSVAIAGPGRLSHSADFSCVSLDGTAFRFGPKQAAVIRLLHQASLRNEPWIPGEALLQAAGSASRRLIDLFKTQPRWRQLIRNDGRGRYRLVPIDGQAFRRKGQYDLKFSSRSREIAVFGSTPVGLNYPTTSLPTASSG